VAKKLRLSYLERENILMFSLGPYSHLADGDGNPRKVKAAAQTLFALTVNNFVKNIFVTSRWAECESWATGG
jgi:hypothetical protein